MVKRRKKIRSRTTKGRRNLASRSFSFNKRKKRKNGKFDRLSFLLVLMFFFVGLIVYRLFNLQVLQHGFYAALAAGQHEIKEQLFPKRGEIFAQDTSPMAALEAEEKLSLVATNRNLYLAYVVPREITEPEEVAETLTELLDIEEEEEKEEFLARLKKSDDLYEPLKHGLSEEKMKEIESLELPGIYFVPESYRYYPEDNIFSHLLGFVGFDETGEKKVGQYGIEGYFDEKLAGQAGFIATEKDALGQWIAVGRRNFTQAQDGDSLVLTVDYNIQYKACRELKAAVEKHGADAGSLIIMEPKTGAILAMCNAPDFNPNEYAETEKIEIFNNAAIFDEYEPGSVFKPITMAMALEEGKVTPKTTYEDKGSVTIGKYTMKNFDGEAHGINTMTQVLENSLNTGAIFAAQKVGNHKFYEYVKKFGFGQRTGIELDSESKGNLSTIAKERDIYTATSSFGQGITVTPLQLLAAFGAIANDGKLVQPYIVDEIIKPSGARVKTEPKEIRQVISSRTASTLSAMLVSVVQNGHGERAGVSGYYVAGKTGTAQVPRQDARGYDPHQHIGSFAGFAPVSNPKFVMLVKIDNPRDVMWAESSAAPLFGKMARFLLNYYQIPPEGEE